MAIRVLQSEVALFTSTSGHMSATTDNNRGRFQGLSILDPSDSSKIMNITGLRFRNSAGSSPYGAVQIFDDEGVSSGSNPPFERFRFKTRSAANWSEVLGSDMSETGDGDLWETTFTQASDFNLYSGIMREELVVTSAAIIDQSTTGVRFTVDNGSAYLNAYSNGDRIEIPPELGSATSGRFGYATMANIDTTSGTFDVVDAGFNFDAVSSVFPGNTSVFPVFDVEFWVDLDPVTEAISDTTHTISLDNSGDTGFSLPDGAYEGLLRSRSNIDNHLVGVFTLSGGQISSFSGNMKGNIVGVSDLNLFLSDDANTRAQIKSTGISVTLN